MAMVDLAGVYRVKAKGRTYYYAWRGKGAPRLEGEPGSPEFIASLQAAQANRKGGDKAKLSGLCIMFRSSDAWNGRGPRPISAKTKASWTTWLDRIQIHFGTLSIAQFDRADMRPRIIKWRDSYASTPRAADMGVQVLSRLLSFGMAEGKLLNNICIGIEGIYSADRSGLIWTETELLELEKHAAPEIVQAARLAALTGLRQSDLLRLSWSHIQPNSIEIATGKSRRRKTTLIPLDATLRAYLEGIKKRATTVLVNTKGRPWRTGFGSSWAEACSNAGIDELHFHDLRGTAATRFYRCGLTIREIAEIMTWAEDYVEALINRYVKKDELLRDRIRRMDENAAGTASAKPPAKPSPKTSTGKAK
jgi:integrase